MSETFVRQLCGIAQRDAEQYSGWAQLGDRTVIDALAEILQRLKRVEDRFLAFLKYPRRG